MVYCAAFYDIRYKAIIPIPIPIKNGVPIDLWDQAWNVFSTLKKSDASYLVIYGLGNRNVFPQEKPKLKEVYNLLKDLQALHEYQINKKFYNEGWYIKPLPKPKPAEQLKPTSVNQLHQAQFMFQQQFLYAFANILTNISNVKQ
jgi:hypothetical protein